ncbi:MAG: hypothetical protein Q9183_004473, partial [Haloplaca sp. 2 TL-2023]
MSPTGSKNPLELTPRSKVKAMMAAIDDDSDPDVLSQPIRHSIETKERPRSSHDEAEASTKPTNDVNSDSVAPKKHFCPRGNIVCRLQGRRGGTSDDQSTDVSDGDDAYSRIRKRLASKSTRSPSQAQYVDVPQMFESTDEADVLQAGTRRRKAQSHMASRNLDSPARSNPSYSPGLFLTPEKEMERGSHVVSPTDQHSRADRSSYEDSDPDLPANPQTNNRFLALVAKKRAEREAKAKAEKEKKAKRSAQTFREDLNSSEESDVVSTKRLTQHTRPTRKASKKALEEMNRETQRMSRNMQLAHQARTKKKITKESLFARFNFRTAAQNADTTSHEVAHPNSSSAAASSNPVSDAEARVSGETPPTSPPGPASETMGSLPIHCESTKVREACTVDHPHLFGEDLPDAQDIILQSQATRGNFVAPETDKSTLDSALTHLPKSKQDIVKSRIQIGVPKTAAKQDVSMGSDSDLEILPENAKKRKTDVFDRLPARKPTEERSLQQLRALAHLSSPGKRGHSKKA